MKKLNIFFNQLFREQTLYLPFLVALLFNAFIWFLIIWRLPASATWIPLHYSTYFGIDWIGPWIKIIYYPTVALFIIIINIIICSAVHDKNQQLGRWLIWSSLLVQIFILISISFLIINYFS